VKWAPIVLFAYDRPGHTRRTLEALAANGGAAESDLVIYSDGPKEPGNADSVRAVREYLKTVNGFKSVDVVERERNLGLANSVIAGVTEVLSGSRSVVVMEDDLLTTRNFLAFVNSALAVYEQRSDVFSVTGYNYPLRIPPSYRDMQMAGELDSWSIRFDYAHYKHDAFCVHPVVSKVQNIGFDGSGVHCGDSDDYDVELDPGDRPFRLDPHLTLDASVLRAFDRKFRPRTGPARLRSGKRIMRRLVSSLR
jgi:hypothetical protein